MGTLVESEPVDGDESPPSLELPAVPPNLRPSISPEVVLVLQGLVQRALSPAAKEAMARAVSQVAEVSRRASEFIRPALDNIRPVLETLARVVLAAATQIQDALPTNWSQLRKWPDPELIEQMLVDEGLALAWVPPTETLQQLIDAKDASARRALIGRQWIKLVAACEGQLNLVTARSLTNYVGFARESAMALRNGTPATAQALNASLLDTLMRGHFDAVTLKDLIGAKRPPADLDRFAIREAFVLLGIYGAYTSWWPSQAEPPPRSFSRHMTAHGVSKRQFNRINAVISLMHVTALIRYLDGQARRSS